MGAVLRCLHVLLLYNVLTWGCRGEEGGGAIVVWGSMRDSYEVTR